MTSPLHLVAYLANAHDEAETLLAVATQNAAGEWHTSEDARVWPYWSAPLAQLMDLAVIPDEVPPGWIEHLHSEAQAYAAARRDQLRPSGLAALLAKAKPTAPSTAPISRRGY